MTLRLKNLEKLGEMLRKNMEWSLGLSRLHPLEEEAIEKTRKQSSATYFKQKQEVMEKRMDVVFNILERI